MQPIKAPSSKAMELEKLRRELLKKIVENEAQRRAARAVDSK
jgi:hypothetical protein